MPLNIDKQKLEMYTCDTDRCILSIWRCAMEEKIIIATLEEMKIHSLRFNMDDLTKRLHMSKTSLYNIINTKDKLIQEVINYLMETFETKEKRILSENTSMREKVSQFVDEYANMFNALDLGVYEDLHMSYPEEWQRLENFRRQKVDTLLDLLNDGMAQGEFRLVDTAVLQCCLLMMSKILADTKFLNDNDLTYSQATDSLQNLIFYGLIKR